MRYIRRFNCSSITEVVLPRAPVVFSPAPPHPCRVVLRYADMHQVDRGFSGQVPATQHRDGLILFLPVPGALDLHDLSAAHKEQHLPLQLSSEGRKFSFHIGADPRKRPGCPIVLYGFHEEIVEGLRKSGERQALPNRGSHRSAQIPSSRCPNLLFFVSR